jgi:prophage regulatory protein
MYTQLQNALVILRCKQVISITGMSRSSLYAMAKAGTFPKPIRLSLRSSGWVESEVQEFIKGRIDASRNQENGGEQ